MAASVYVIGGLIGYVLLGTSVADNLLKNFDNDEKFGVARLMLSLTNMFSSGSCTGFRQNDALDIPCTTEEGPSWLLDFSKSRSLRKAGFDEIHPSVTMYFMRSELP